MPEVDTTENRFVLYTLREIAKRLGAFADDCDDHPTVSRDFVGKLREYVSRLERKARHPFFSPVGRFAGFRQESLAIQRKRGYATIYGTWRNLKRSLDATKEGMAVGHRPISALYEFWCFLVMRDILAETYGQPSLTTGEIKSLGRRQEGTGSFRPAALLSWWARHLEKVMLLTFLLPGMSGI